MQKLKKIPKFGTEKQEREFWQKADSTKYVDWSKAEHWVFPNLKLSSVPITMRLPQSWVDRAKLEANRRSMAYQTLIKQTIYEGMRSWE